MTPNSSNMKMGSKRVNDAVEDKSERKKLREKNRRSEVNDKFSELADLIQHSEGILNKRIDVSELEKTSSIKSDIICKAIITIRRIMEQNLSFREKLELADSGDPGAGTNPTSELENPSSGGDSPRSHNTSPDEIIPDFQQNNHHHDVRINGGLLTTGGSFEFVPGGSLLGGVEISNNHVQGIQDRVHHIFDIQRQINQNQYHNINILEQPNSQILRIDPSTRTVIPLPFPGQGLGLTREITVCPHLRTAPVPPAVPAPALVPAFPVTVMSRETPMQATGVPAIGTMSLSSPNGLAILADIATSHNNNNNTNNYNNNSNNNSSNNGNNNNGNNSSSSDNNGRNGKETGSLYSGILFTEENIIYSDSDVDTEVSSGSKTHAECA